MKINIVLSYPSLLGEWAQVISYNLRKLGIESDLCVPKLHKSDSEDLVNYRCPEADYYIILNQAEFFMQNIPNDSKKICWFTEPIGFDSEDQNLKAKADHLKEMREHCELLIVPERSTAQEANEHNVRVDAVLGVGYDDLFNHYNDSLERNVNIYFEGGINSRRRSIIETFKTPITKHGCFGDAYHQMLAQAKVALNIHSYDCKTSFGFLRIMMSISESTLVISETIEDPYPFLNKEHLVICDKNNIASVCEDYLEEKYEIGRQIALDAHKFVKEKYQMKDLLCKFIQGYVDNTFVGKDLDVEIPEIKGE